MTKLDKLYDIANDKHIEIVNGHFSGTKKACCVQDSDIRAVVLDKPAINDTAEEAVLLAEEIGHYEMDAFYIMSSDINSSLVRLNRIKAERLARKWAIRELVPIEEIRKCLSQNITDIMDIADRLSITPDFAAVACEYYLISGILISSDQESE